MNRYIIQYRETHDGRLQRLGSMSAISSAKALVKAASILDRECVEAVCIVVTEQDDSVQRIARVRADGPGRYLVTVDAQGCVYKYGVQCRSREELEREIYSLLRDDGIGGTLKIQFEE